MITRLALALLLLISGAAAGFAAYRHFSAVVSKAEAEERAGFTRGPILDRNGKSLAFSRRNGSMATRVYPHADLVHLIGYLGPSKGWRGLEGVYSDFLSATRARKDWHTFFLHLQGRTADGGKLRLTIDARLQQAADRALGNGTGSVVVVQPSTGQILALVSKPYCKPVALTTMSGLQACRKQLHEPFLNRGLQALLPSGSTYKIVTLAAALDTGRFALSTVFSGPDAFGPSPYFNSSLYGSNVTDPTLTQLTLEQALDFSDNFTFAAVGLRLGGQTLLDYAQRFYIGRHIPFPLPVAVSTIAGGSKAPDASALAQSSFGGPPDKATPFQMALIAAAVANGGTLMAPQIVEQRESPTGRLLGRPQAVALSHVMSRHAASEVSRAMVSVVTHGTGRLAGLPGIQVAGKTGTAPGATRPDAWFIGFAPAQRPQVAIAVIRESSGEGAQFAAPIARAVFKAALSERTGLNR